MNWLKRFRSQPSGQCEICGNEYQLELLPLVRGRRGQVEVFFQDLPVLSCGLPGHPRRYVLPDFGVLLIDVVFWKKFVPLGRPGVWALVKCLNCDKNLTKVDEHFGEVAGVLEIKDVPPFGIRIQGPVTTCPRCQTRQLKATKAVGTDVSGSFVEAFKNIQLEP